MQKACLCIVFVGGLPSPEICLVVSQQVQHGTWKQKYGIITSI